MGKIIVVLLIYARLSLAAEVQQDNSIPSPLPVDIIAEIVDHLSHDIHGLLAFMSTNKLMRESIQKLNGLSLNLRAFAEKVDDDVLEQITTLFPNLKSLDLGFCQKISPEAFDKYLRRLTKCNSLDLTETRVTSLDFVAAMPNLKTLRLRATGVVDLSILKTLPLSQYLMLSGSIADSRGQFQEAAAYYDELLDLPRYSDDVEYLQLSAQAHLHAASRRQLLKDIKYTHYNQAALLFDKILFLGVDDPQLIEMAATAHRSAALTVPLEESTKRYSHFKQAAMLFERLLVLRDKYSSNDYTSIMILAASILTATADNAPSTDLAGRDSYYKKAAAIYEELLTLPDFAKDKKLLEKLLTIKAKISHPEN